LSLINWLLELLETCASILERCFQFGMRSLELVSHLDTHDTNTNGGSAKTKESSLSKASKFVE